MHICIHAPSKDSGKRGSQEKKKKNKTKTHFYRNTHGKYFLDECLKGVNPAKMTYLPALSFVAWNNKDMMARAKAAIWTMSVLCNRCQILRIEKEHGILMSVEPLKQS